MTFLTCTHLFVLDGSSSVGENNFTIATNFIANLTSRFDISPGKVQIGLVQYATTPQTEIELGEFTNKEDLMEAIRAVQWKWGDTFTGEALQKL